MHDQTRQRRVGVGIYRVVVSTLKGTGGDDQHVRKTRWGLAILALLLVLPTFAIAEDAPEKLREGFLINGMVIRHQFRETVAQSHKWTVAFEKYNSAKQTHEQVALGMIVDANGWIVSKASEIKDADRCLLSDGETLEFAHVGFDSSLDLALVKVAKQGLSTVEWSDQSPAVGHWAITSDISPMPLAIGVISVDRRKIPESNIYGVMGIELADLSDTVIKTVFPKGGAEAAGVRPGDRVLRADGRSIASGDELIRMIRGLRPGDTLVFDLERNGNEQRLAVTLTYPFDNFMSRIASQNEMGSVLSFRRDNFPSVYQHDAVIRAQDCGGALVLLDGKAIGLNIARAGRTETYALPADLVKDAVAQMRSGRNPSPFAKLIDKRPPAVPTPEILNEKPVSFSGKGRRKNQL